ncbi:MAG: 1-aminocyclopropane-1-carboxylate deaminase/D-cysteine desulfhydrase [Cyclobacteriaceae bacterium]|nr:1-aminocyclopropane-1-carboxylate deaminase/D-cysteine desulfhydrase [Cyclobacteriaceae bacterium]
MLQYKNSPIIELKLRIFEEANVRVLVKCEYLNHPFISGNKWWKLKYNLEAATKRDHKTILTFGGAYSNHIYATAAAARELGLKSIGIIRGEETLPLNPTLSFAKECGMELHYVSREMYRTKNEESFLQKLKDQYGDFYLIPEGGTNELAVKGVKEFAQSLNQEAEFDYLCLPVGTGGTMAGIIEGLDKSKQVLGFVSLKGGQFLEHEIQIYTRRKNFNLLHDYHFGGYGKMTQSLTDFTNQFEKDNSVQLDPVYTSKMMLGVFDLARDGFFKKDSIVMILHTGGLQGRPQ